MNEVYSRLGYLFDAYFAKTATEQEKEELFLLIQSSKTDQELAALISHTWQNMAQVQAPFFEASKSEAILNNILRKENQIANHQNNRTTNSNPWRISLAVAAVMLFFLSFAVFITKNLPRKNRKVIAKTSPSKDILPGGNKAVLKLGSGQTIVLDNAQVGTVVKVGDTKINKTRDGLLVYKASESASHNAAYSFNTIKTPRGGQYQIILPDGSNVWLNAASSLRFPTRFTGKFREVEITGEAYFEVAKNAAVPFIVKNRRAEIQVLGTHFNVMAYDDESEMETTLLKGAVKIKSKNAVNILKPGQQVAVNESGLQNAPHNVDTDEAVAWKNGMFQFQDAGIEVIMRQVERWYNVKVSYEGKVTPRQFTGTISRNVKAPVLLDMLKYSGVNFEINDKNILVKR
jgi:transmembrane sensor